MTATAVVPALGTVLIPRVASAATDMGSPALESLTGQAVLWGLAVAVAMVIVCAAAWAIGSASSHPQAAAKAKTGILVALIGALLLGAGQGYLSWLDSGQAEAFTADPASYKAETAAPRPGVEIVDKTADWMVAVNHYRRSTPAAEAASDPALESLAASCASKIAAGQGVCPGAGQYYAVKLAPSQIAMLTGALSPDQLAADAPDLTADLSGLTGDPRIAIVAARNTQNGSTALVFVISAGPCAYPCAPKPDGAVVPGLITHTATTQW